MDRASLVAATEREGAALLAAGSVDLTAAVPTCPGWVVADILGHLGRVYRSVSEIIERRAQQIPDVAIPRPPEGPEVLDFYRAGLERLVGALAGIEPDEPVYTWSGHGDGRFYHRRMAHETAVHRWDAQAAHGTPEPVAADQAADGIDELYTVVLPFGVQRWPRSLPAGTLHLHRDDGPGEWLVRAHDGAITVERQHAKGDVAVRGPAPDLFVFAWNRGRGGGLTVFGDTALADEWARLAP